VFPDSSNLLNYTTTFNLTAELNNMTSHFDNLTAAVLSEVDSSIGQITSTIDPLIQSVQTQVNQLMNNVTPKTFFFLLLTRLAFRPSTPSLTRFPVSSPRWIRIFSLEAWCMCPITTGIFVFFFFWGP